MWLSKYFVYFIFFSFCGWLYETIYALLTTKKWNNRGFLFGPICPIYGVGADAIIGISNLFSMYAAKGEVSYTWWQIFLISFFGSFVLEYVTSFVLEKRFHAIWWDYSKVPFNIHGRVCLPASLGFGLAGDFVVYVVAPHTVNMTYFVPPIVMEFLSLILMALFAADLTLTVVSLTEFERFVVEWDQRVTSYMEEFVEGIQEKTQDLSQRLLEEKERVTLDGARQLIDSTSDAYRSALYRVRNFKHPRIESHRMEVILEELKKRKNK